MMTLDFEITGDDYHNVRDTLLGWCGKSPDSRRGVVILASLIHI